MEKIQKEKSLINYNDKKFRPVLSSDNAETSQDTTFHYFQSENILHASYSGGSIIKGTLIGIVHPDGKIDMRYQQINKKHELMTGKCHSVPEILPDGRIRLHEKWQWTSGDCSEGESVIEEV